MNCGSMERTAYCRPTSPSPPLRPRITEVRWRGKFAIAIAGIGQRLVHRHQREQLQGVDRRQGVGRNAVAHGIERHRVQEAAPARMDFVLRLAVGIVIQIDVEALLGNVGDGIDLIQDIGPEGAHVGRFGQQAAHAHDGHVERLGRRQDFLDARARERHGQLGDPAGRLLR